MFNRKYNTNINFLDYQSIISAIPRNWKLLIKNKENKVKSGINFEIVKYQNLSKLSNKIFYNELIKVSWVPPTNQNKWIEYYPYLETADWKSIYRLPYKICRDTFSQSLQYKILHRYINCNYNLHIWGIKETSSCKYCDKVDTLEHFFYECMYVLEFWNSVQKWLKSVTKVSFSFTLFEVIFGNLQDDTHVLVRNFVILQGKKYIYEKRNQESEMFLLEFLCKLKHSLIIEKEICNIKDESKVFDKKFGFIYDSL